jgi:hypothetical protein
MALPARASLNSGAIERSRAIVKLLTDPVVRAAIFPGTDDELAEALRRLDPAAQSEGPERRTEGSPCQIGWPPKPADSGALGRTVALLRAT